MLLECMYMSYIMNEVPKTVRNTSSERVPIHTVVAKDVHRKESMGPSEQVWGVRRVQVFSTCSGCSAGSAGSVRSGKRFGMFRNGLERTS